MGWTITLVVVMTMNGQPVPTATHVADVPAEAARAGYGWPRDLPFGAPATPDDAMCIAYEAMWRERAMQTLERGGPSSATYSFHCSVTRRT